MFKPASPSGDFTILTPDGQPAADARLWAAVTLPSSSMSLIGSGSGSRNWRYFGNAAPEAQTDEFGHVPLPPGVPEAPIVVVHDEGFLAMTRANFSKTREIRLEAYGRVEGQLIVAGEPSPNTMIQLRTLVHPGVSGVHLDLTTRTDPEGTFVLEQVPPGEYLLSRRPRPKRGGRQSSDVRLQQMPVLVGAGHTLRVTYASQGRPLVGRIVPSRAEAEVDWQSDLHILSLKVPSVPRGSIPNIPNWEDYATREAYRTASEPFQIGALNVEEARRERTYDLEIEPDGAFRIDDVPPGTYELRVTITMPKREGETFADLEKLIREIVVPEGDGLVELGTLTLPIRRPVSPPSP